MAIPAGALGNAFSEVVEKELNEDGENEERKHDLVLFGSRVICNHAPSCSHIWLHKADSRFASCRNQQR